MTKIEKILNQVLRGTSDVNIDFDDLRSLLHQLGFEERIKGSHHIFWKKEVVEIINLQPKRSKVKLYQVKQIRNVIVKYKLGDLSGE
ncbi:MAG: toxin HicA [Caldithrix sp. RBG_13_44_9]|nr:MAG: toxin HicA [Caldithrix sp. RBG_13_44_9]